MRRQADGVVVLLRSKPYRTCTDFFQNLDESGDPRVIRVVSFANQRIGSALKKLRIGVSDAVKPSPRNRGPAKENWTNLFDKQLGGSLDDAHLGAAHVGNERVRGRVMRDFREQIESVSDRKGAIYQVRPADRGFK